jgi:hypothetical protein
MTQPEKILTFRVHHLVLMMETQMVVLLVMVMVLPSLSTLAWYVGLT